MVKHWETNLFPFQHIPFPFFTLEKTPKWLSTIKNKNGSSHYVEAYSNPERRNTFVLSHGEIINLTLMWNQWKATETKKYFDIRVFQFISLCIDWWYIKYIVRVIFWCYSLFSIKIRNGIGIHFHQSVLEISFDKKKYQDALINLETSLRLLPSTLQWRLLRVNPDFSLITTAQLCFFWWRSLFQLFLNTL